MWLACNGVLSVLLVWSPEAEGGNQVGMAEPALRLTPSLLLPRCTTPIALTRTTHSSAPRWLTCPSLQDPGNFYFPQSR